MSKYVRYKKVKEVFDVTSQTVKNWALRDIINYKAIQNKSKITWLYDLESIGNYLSNTTKDPVVKSSTTIIYARVSSKKQEPDLLRQCQLLKDNYPDAEIIKDIASGLNFKRNGFSQLISKILRGEVQRVVVTYRDRLMRFGYELFEQICNENGTQIMVYSQNNKLIDVEENETQELQEDLLSIVNVFIARRNGKRAGLLRRERSKLNNENKIVSNTITEDKTE